MSAPAADGDGTRSRSRERTLSVAAVLAAIVVFVVVAYLVGRDDPSAAPPPEASAILPELRPEIRPEPHEKRLFQAGLVIGAALPFAVFAALARAARRWPRFGAFLDRGSAVPEAIALLAVAAWVGALWDASALPDATFDLVVSLPAAALIAATSRVVVGTKLAWLRAIVFMLLGLFFVRFSVCTWDLHRELPEVALHVDLLYGAIAQVAHGRVVLVDTTSQYGVLYPYVYALVLAPFGLSATSVSAAFVATGLVSLGFVYAALRRSAGSLKATLLPDALFVGVVGWLFTFPMAAIFKSLWVYYQYFPLRLVFPTIFVWFVGGYVRAERARKGRLAVVGHALAATSVLWNADTGLVLFVAWIATLGFEQIRLEGWELRRVLPRAAKLAAGAAVALAIAIAIYAVFARVRSGQLPHLREALEYQRIFYAVGFYMLPMKTWEIWQLVLGFPLVVLFDSLRRTLARGADPGASERFFLALFGCGAFSYYQGRSHVMVLMVVVYPTALLGAFVFFDLVRRWREERVPLDTWTVGLGIVSLLVPALGWVHWGIAAPRAVAVVEEPRTPSEDREAERRRLAIVRDRWQGKELPFVGYKSGYLHLETGTFSPFPLSSLTEVITSAQEEQVLRTVRERGYKMVIAYGPLQPTTRRLGVPIVPFDEWVDGSGAGDVR